MNGAGIVRRWQIGESGAVMMGSVIASPDRHAAATRVHNAHTRRDDRGERGVEGPRPSLFLWQLLAAPLQSSVP